MSPREIIDETLRISGRGTLAELEAARWLDCQPPFETAHFLNGFAHGDGKFHFRADWANVPDDNDGLCGPWRGLPSLPDHWAVNEGADADHPSSSRPRLRATSSIRASARLRPRSPARATQARSCIPGTWWSSD